MLVGVKCVCRQLSEIKMKNLSQEVQRLALQQNHLLVRQSVPMTPEFAFWQCKVYLLVPAPLS